MSILVSCERLSHEWPGKRVLQDQTIGIYEGERIGIVGRNGDGKSTLLSLIAKDIEPDSGNVTYRGGIAVGVLGQNDELDDDETLEHAVVGDMPTYEWASNARTREIVEVLLGDLDWHGRVGDLSGGQRRRADLARLLVGTWDVVLMDEPTNHLDLHAIQWLAQHLKRRWHDDAGALLVVTHDRWFLDEVCTSMWEVHDGSIEPFEGGFSAYVQQRVERDRVASVMEQRRQSMLRKELNWLAHGPKARTSKPKFRVDAALELIANDPPLRNPIELQRMAVSRLGKQVIEARDVCVSYDGTTNVLDCVSWIIGPGDRVGILGENGAGKSTLLRVLCGKQQPTSGWVKIGKTVRFGWLGQRLEWLTDHDDWRVSELLGLFKRSYVIEGKSQSPEQLVERLGFERGELSTYVRDLSGGQQRRLAILCVLMEEPNVMVLDEPGNDLDTDMLAVIEELLDTWPGTLIMVSHDRTLIERVTDDQFSLINGHVSHCPRGVDEYLARLEDAHNVARASAGHANDNDSAQKKAEATGLSNAERRELKRRYDSVERRLEKYADEPERLRQEMADVDPSDYEALMQAQKRVDEAQRALEQLEDEWLDLATRLGIS